LTQIRVLQAEVEIQTKKGIHSLITEEVRQGDVTVGVKCVWTVITANKV